MSPSKLLIVALGLGILAAPLAAHGQPPAKIPRIGYLVLAPLAEKPSPERAAFLEGLRALGYVEGKNIAIEYRSARSGSSSAFQPADRYSIATVLPST